MTKYCPKCKNHLEFQYFNNNKARKAGLSDWCQLCNRDSYKLYYLKKYPPKPPKPYESPEAKKERRLQTKRNWRKKAGPDKFKQYKIKAKLKNPNINKEAYLREKIRNGGKPRKTKRTEARNIYEKRRAHTDPNFKIARNLRARLRNALHKNQKIGSAVEDLGCSIAKLRIRLQLMFTRNPQNSREYMSWSNYGLHGWHIDHIIPLSSFDLTDRDQFLKANHYTNLQPLWAKENRKKLNKIP